MSIPASVTPGRTGRCNLVPRARLGRWALALAGVLAAGGASRAQVVAVNYGGDYGASNQTFTATPQNQTGEFFGASAGHDSRVIVHFSTSTPLINLAGTSGKYYGGYESVNFGQGGPSPIKPAARTRGSR